MASMTPGCILSISSKMKTEEGQALTLPRIQFCSCSWNKRLKATEKQGLYWMYCKILVCDTQDSGDTLSNLSIPHSLAGEWKRKKPRKWNHPTHADQCSARARAATTLETNAPPFFPSSTPIFMADRDSMWYGISFWPTGVSCPGCASSSSLAHPSQLNMSGKN